MSHLRVGLSALSIHLELALHSAGHPVPVSGVHPHPVITPSHSFQGCGARGRGARAAPGRRRWPPCRGSPGLWRAILPLQTRRPWGLMPPSRTIATPVAALCTWVESKGDGGVVDLLGSRGQRGRSGPVQAMLCSETWGFFVRSLSALLCCLRRWLV